MPEIIPKPEIVLDATQESVFKQGIINQILVVNATYSKNKEDAVRGFKEYSSSAIRQEKDEFMPQTVGVFIEQDKAMFPILDIRFKLVIAIEKFEKNTRDFLLPFSRLVEEARINETVIASAEQYCKHFNLPYELILNFQFLGFNKCKKLKARAHFCIGNAYQCKKAEDINECLKSILDKMDEQKEIKDYFLFSFLSVCTDYKNIFEIYQPAIDLMFSDSYSSKDRNESIKFEPVKKVNFLRNILGINKARQLAMLFGCMSIITLYYYTKGDFEGRETEMLSYIALNFGMFIGTVVFIKSELNSNFVIKHTKYAKKESKEMLDQSQKSSEKEFDECETLEDIS